MQKRTQNRTEQLLPERTGPTHSEDLAWKAASAYFGDELIQWLGIPEKAVRSVPTEMVHLELRHFYEDFLYEMENGLFYHFEFESDAITEADLRRFREYDASVSRAYDIPVITYVICSSRVRSLRDTLTEGINTYRVRVIRLKGEDADQILENLSNRLNGEIRPAELIPLLFSPLLGGESDLPHRVLQSIRILRKAEPSLPAPDIQRMEAILSVLAGKFLKEEDLSLIKEEIAMTKLGQMIWDDALRVGKEQGERIGREQGERIGREQGQERYSRLILLLDHDRKGDLIVKAASDPVFREALYKKYKI